MNSPAVRALAAKRKLDYTHLLNTTVDDPLEVREKDAISDENAAVTEYSAYVNEAQAARAALQGKIISAQERKAGLEVQVAQGVRATDELMADLAALADEEGQLHKSCDFVQQNFDVRQKARAQELEALAQAKAILSGAGAR